MKKTLLLLLLLIPVLGSSVWAETETYAVDTAHSQVHFTVPHLVAFKVRGTFNEFSGSVEVDADAQAITAAQATIDAASVNTRNEKRDKHLRSPDFFSVDEYPEIHFVSTSVTGSGDDITVVGNLTIRGVTREVILQGAMVGNITDPWGNKRVGFEATGEVNRKDFDLTWNKVMETGGLVVGDMVEIGLEIEAFAEQ